MAVTMSAGGYMRSDFMISDAALPIRIEELQQEQATEFAKILDSFDNAAAVSETAGAGATDSVQSETMTVSRMEDSSPLKPLKMGEVRLEDCDEQTRKALLAASLPDDPRALMRMVLRGDIKLSDIPEDKLSPAFLMLLAFIMRTNPELLEGKESDKTGEEDGEKTVRESDFDYDKLLDEMLCNQDQLMAQLLIVPVDKTDEMGSITTDAKKMIEEIISVNESEPALMSWSKHINTEVEELLTRENEENVDKALLERLLGENAADSGLIHTAGLTNVEKAELTAAAPQPEVGDKDPAAAEIPAVPKTSAEVQSADVQTANVHEIVNTAAENGAAGISVNMMNKQTDSVSGKIPVTKELAYEDAQQFVISAAAPAANTEGMEHESGTSGNGQMLSDKEMPFVRQTADTANIADVKAAAFEVKQDPAGVTEQTGKPIGTEKPAQADVKTLVQSRVKSATEELELLKGAKSKNAAADGTELLRHTENPLISDEPIVFLRDGGRVEVRPSEILSQAAEKLIETARDMPKGETEYSLELNPEELGKITVKMTKAADGAVTVTIAAENARTRRVLEENSGVMQDNLRNNGVRLESWQTVGESARDNRAQDYNGSAKNPYHHENSHKNGNEENDSTFAELIASM